MKVYVGAEAISRRRRKSKVKNRDVSERKEGRGQGKGEVLNHLNDYKLNY